ncbi:MFS transporter [Dasania sp. GY-MA-18]|uniref:MFS transporter n=1 Tax=Dasania phycosphaerae TaxID=2950436 RepID=A0A9J6RJM3_9GAMM|nr:MULTISPECIES: MFS transporter [Dasania]MCR8922247.1 MFS transporter [Dasania sp. GY-MA-18]MCZ0864675.1 MFS transporter [Dasania phycosphaerae]MCZ0868403.1 MFS transporter [Dasania phycosphaerae]
MSHTAVPDAPATKPSLLKRLPVAPANGELARVLLSFLATAGLFYVNIMPALIDGLIDGLGFSNKEAGFVGSANVYGAAVGALAAVFIVKFINWKKAALLLLLGLLLADCFSIYLTQVSALVITRFFHGCIGGMLVGIGFAVIARTTEADRTFGYLLTVQFGLGGAGLMFLPPLVPEFGTTALFLALMAFSAITLCMLPFLADYKVAELQLDHKKLAAQKINYKLLSLALLATFLFQAANMGVYAYVIGLGKTAGQDMLFISSTLGFAAWIAIAGSVLVIVMSTRFGRLWPILIATLLTIVGTWLFHYSDSKSYYWVANVGVGITWAFVISYLLGMCAEFDSSGQMAALGGFASKMGLASGPLTAALIVGDNNYGLLINVACIALILCMAAVMLPALALDKAR